LIGYHPCPGLVIIGDGHGQQWRVPSDELFILNIHIRNGYLSGKRRIFGIGGFEIIFTSSAISHGRVSIKCNSAFPERDKGLAEPAGTLGFKATE